MDSAYYVVAFLFLCGLAFFGLIRNPTVMNFVAHVSITKEGISKLRRALLTELDDYDIGDMSALDAEDDIAERVRHIIGKTLAEINPRQPIEVTKTWPPEPKVIITEGIAVIQPSIGILIMGPHERIEPIKVRIRQNGVIKLSNSRPIKDAYEEMHAPPPKVPEAKPQRAKVSRPTVAKK